MLYKAHKFGAAACSATFVFLLGCEPAPKVTGPTPGTIEYKIAQIGDSAVASRYPTYDRKKYPVLITQHKDTWNFEYQLPAGMIGGTPVVEIEKGTFKVTKVYESQ